jgi:V/A-type H+/Na+-transporting ATPase subunit I
MIIPMSKFSFLVFHKDYQVFLDQMREFGVLHLIEKQHEISDDIRVQYDLVRQIVSVIKSLEKREVEQTNEAVSAQGEDLYKEVVDLQEQLEQKVLQLNQLNKEISQVRHWGDFSTETITKLKENNISLKFYTVSSRKFQESWLQEYPIEILSQHGGLTYFVLVHQGTDDIGLDAEEMRSPEKPISELTFYQKELEKDIDRINDKIDRHASESLQEIKQYRLEVIEQINYEKVIENTVKEADDKVMLLEGWVPEGKEKPLLGYLETNNILYVSEKPAKGRQSTRIIEK